MPQKKTTLMLIAMQTAAEVVGRLQAAPEAEVAVVDRRSMDDADCCADVANCPDNDDDIVVVDADCIGADHTDLDLVELLIGSSATCCCGSIAQQHFPSDDRFQTGRSRAAPSWA